MCFRANSFFFESNLILHPFVSDPKDIPLPILPIDFRYPKHFERKLIHGFPILLFLKDDELMGVAGEETGIPA